MGWYNSSWQYRQKITVDHTKVGASLTNFPVYINLANLASGFFTHVQSGGGDIRVTESDGVTEVAREIVYCNTGSSTGEIHFNAPSLSNSVDTSFYIYYGNSGASDYAANATYGKYNVWDSNYRSVYHFEGNSNDSTSNQVNGTDTSVTYGTSYGKLSGKGASFNGSSSTIARAYANIGTTLSLETWFNLSSLTTTEAYLALMSVLTQAASGATPLYWYPNVAGGSSGPSVNPTVNLSTFYHWAITISGTTANYIFNGAQQGAANQTVAGVNTANNSTDTIGSWGASRYWPGYLDELRISTSVRSLGWYTTQYNDQNSNSTFYSVASQEKAPAGGAFLLNFI